MTTLRSDQELQVTEKKLARNNHSTKRTVLYDVYITLSFSCGHIKYLDRLLIIAQALLNKKNRFDI